MDDQESDENVLNREEKVLSVRGEGEVVPIGVCECDCVCESLKDVGRQGQPACRFCRRDYEKCDQNISNLILSPRLR